MTFQDWTLNPTGFSVQPTIATARYGVAGKVFKGIFHMPGGTSNATTFTISFPSGITAKGLQVVGLSRAVNNGAAAVSTGIAVTADGSGTITLYLTAAAGAWTGSGTKGASGILEFEIN